MVFVAMVSFFIAALSGMGLGGGGLFVAFLALFSPTPQLLSQGMNLLFFLFSSGSAVLIHLSKRQIFSGAVFILIIFGILGSVLGTVLANFTSSIILRKIFGTMLIISGVFSLKS